MICNQSVESALGASAWTAAMAVDLERSRPVAAQAPDDEVVAFTCQRSVPLAAVLVGETHHRPVGSRGAGTACLGEQHQGEQSDGFWLVRHQVDEGPSEPDGFDGEIGSREHFPRGGGVTLRV